MATMKVAGAGCSLGLAGFGEENFGRAVLGNTLRTQRLVDLADRIMAHPGGSLPEKVHDPAALKALYRLMSQEAVTHAAVLGPHRARVRERIAATAGVVLLLHDTTSLNYSSHRALRDQLGSIGKGKGRGLLCQNVLAVRAGDRTVLGLLHQQLVNRRNKAPRKHESRAQRRARPDRESRLWQQAAEAIGPAPWGVQFIDVADRGADLFEFIAYEQAAGRDFVVRSKVDRSIAGATAAAPPGKLYALARGLAAQTRWQLAVPAQGRHQARTATVAAAAAPVTLWAPKHPRGQHGPAPVAAWVIRVWEPDPPPGVKAVEWILLTSLPCATVEALRTCVGYYEARWIIEEYHKCQKTGCGIELPQMTEVARLEPTIALLSVVAVGLLVLRDAARRTDLAEQAAVTQMPALHVQVLQAWRYGPSRPPPRAPLAPMTLREFCLALARLGGHQNRRSDGLPGWITLWRGWNRLTDMVQGAKTQLSPRIPMRRKGG